MAKKNKKKPLTKAQKKARGMLALYIIILIILCDALIFGIFSMINSGTADSLNELATKFKAAEYAPGEQLTPVLDSDGYWTFTTTTDREFKILQLTDVHLGAGCFSVKKDKWAMNAVASMITTEKPDLVVVTGDVSYPVPFSSGSFNNYNPAEVFGTLMNKLGVYWTFAYGNHDTEAYSYCPREKINEYYTGISRSKDPNSYCLYQNVEGIANYGEGDPGYGNQIIKIKNSAGIVKQAVVVFDSHSYTDGDAFGLLWKYDNIHESQIEWYKSEMQRLTKENKENQNLGAADPQVKNLMFFHIALKEYRLGWVKLVNADVNKDVTDGKYNDIEDVKYFFGVMGENASTMNPLAKTGEDLHGIFSGIHEDEVFETGAENGLQGVFCGHDHLNNFSIEYKGIRLTYGMSVDYLAYAGIYKQKAQRGCTLIYVKPDGSFDCEQSNYYKLGEDGKEFYQAQFDKQ